MAGIADKRRGLGQAEVLALIASAGVALTSDTPEPLGSAAVGVATTAARADHVHAHGTYASGNLHTEYQQESAKGAADGYAALDGASQVPASQAPAKAVYASGGGQALAPSDIGARAAGFTEYQLAGTLPSFGTLITVPTDRTLGRLLFGSIEIKNSASNEARVDIEVETGVGTGSYTLAVRKQLPSAGTVRSSIDAYVCFIPAGRRYRFIRAALGGGATEAITQYNYMDL